MKTGGTAILRRTLVRNRVRLGIGTVLVCLHQVAETLVPISIGVIVDRAVATGDVFALSVWLCALALLFLVLTAAWRFGARFIVVAMQNEAHQLRMEVAHRILDPRGVRTDLRAGELLSVSTSDADRAAWIADITPRAAAALTAAIGSAVALLLIDVPLGLAVLIGTPVILGLLQLAAPLITRRATDQQAAVARASAMATDLVSGLRPLRGIGAEVSASRRYRTASREALGATLHTAKSSAVFAGVSMTVSALLAVGVAGVAGWFALEGRITIGELITVVGLSQFFIEPLGVLAGLPGFLALARASADRLALVLDAEPLLPAGSGRTLDGSELSLTGVSYRSLSAVDLQVTPGELLGVVAYRPQDAEALAALLSGQVPPDRYDGELTVGGVRLSDADLAQARRALLVEPHNGDLFSGTVASNVTAGRPGATAAEVQAALSASAAVDVVEAHPEGLDHEVADRGSSLSGGQRQRVALARALVAQSPVMVLHDPTTAVDAVTEHTIAGGIADLRHRGSADRQTTILITSSPALLSVTDRVVVLDDGTVVGEGTHSQLATENANYRQAVLR
ncbi:bifunctional ABC transporter [Rhodococcus opacus PD630]|uniref:ABC transporter ATP-binding protein n=1 Tax=Rhodococcus opacus TaxID=37919 RepID=UPI00029CB14D|nr:ABC transporter ATP-binding protein [Rhodococcus opacus]AHK28450.1 Lipid A export ATP-binding/permease protein MsbA [Rhodococcus opacus PD630]EHI44488.1 bifunctional ABC transporter [Rhodococcus opacus PD630]UDG98336.1 ABC transporter ATP-binding protein/permease [Rhodococcus opacus PD630]